MTRLGTGVGFNVHFIVRRGLSLNECRKIVCPGRFSLTRVNLLSL